ncbi:carboxypeptidase-like regulatory domain-containing protein [Flavobacterium sp. '19STA2R22 D10 B1']|uniref:carboxypeptidase-like regulatory domain-containing protein n=1 Tax=Flavobacterium aerium TaxID=3037261 RepID=UPI00278C0B49|nr:carboxypeptidase-like regulatory domain-containing protein [Flavobacterium sp. '19STA2R22 D10 B1']
MKNFLLLLCLLFFGSLTAQTLSGYVYDEVTKKPIEGANVYLDGTTFGTMTNNEGYFAIALSGKTQNTLVFSFVGYETLTVDKAANQGKSFKVYMKEDLVALQEVMVSNGPFSRKKMLQAFKEYFLGSSKTAKSCKILNEDDINVQYDVKTNTLTASARSPLKIINKQLEYEILFDLSYFEVKYFATSLASFDVIQSVYLGTTFFKDVSKGSKSAVKKRKETYLGSANHLMKTIAEESWESEKFELYVNRFKDDPKNYFKTSDTLEGKKIKIIGLPKKEKRSTSLTLAESERMIAQSKPGYVWIKEYFHIRYDAGNVSIMDFLQPEIYVDKNGNYTPVTGVVFGTYIGSLKAGDLLPMDYVFSK